MNSCLHQDTLKTTPTDIFLQIAKEAGFEAIELATDKVELIIQEGEVGKLKEHIQHQGLVVASINGPEKFNLLPDNEFSILLERTRKLASVASELGCNLLVPVPSPSKKPNSKEIIQQCVHALNSLAEACGKDIRLGLEFLGMAECSINNLAAANEVVSKVGRENVGLVLDSFHMHLSETAFTEVAKIRENGVFLVHVNDSEEGDTSKLTDAQRLFPGEGVIDLKAFKSNLASAGYDGYISLELLRPSYWEQDPRQIASIGRESLKHTFGI
jgi:2-keto-myo-inositol isomerase